jgi:hypothetical protein
MGREMIGWLTHIQHTRGKNVIFVGILENLKDEFNVTSWHLQIEGSKTGKELPGIVDQIATMQFVDFGDGTFRCARWFAPSLTHGPIPRRIAAGAWNKSKNRTSASGSPSSPARASASRWCIRFPVKAEPAPEKAEQVAA